MPDTTSKRFNGTLKIAIAASLLAPLCLYALGWKKDFLGCSWDMRGVHIQRDGGYARRDSDELTGDNFRIYFYDDPFQGLGTWVDYLSRSEKDSGLVTSRFVTNDEIPSPGVSVHVIESDWHIGHVVIFNRAPAGLIDGCE